MFASANFVHQTGFLPNIKSTNTFIDLWVHEFVCTLSALYTYTTLWTLAQALAQAFTFIKKKNIIYSEWSENRTAKNPTKLIFNVNSMHWWRWIFKQNHWICSLGSFSSICPVPFRSVPSRPIEYIFMCFNYSLKFQSIRACNSNHHRNNTNKHDNLIG